jgi:ParB-like chromosome segregation protein Spo0J
LNGKRNTACTIGLRQIEESQELALGAAHVDIAKYEKVAASFGNVAPAIVAVNGGMYSLVDGHARLEACRRAGANDIPAVVAQAEGEAERLKLSLLLCASREQGSALAEGALIEKLANGHGYSLGELSRFVGRSKAWLSKRQAMARNLSPAVRGMVLHGTICTRTAEEIAKLPTGEQALFGANIAKEGLNKDDAGRLVKLYRSPDATLALCRMIVESPAQALLACPKAGKTRKGRGAGAAARLAGTAQYAAGILDELGKMIGEADGTAVAGAMEHLLRLHRKTEALSWLIAAHAQAGVSLGKQGGGQVD